MWNFLRNFIVLPLLIGTIVLTAWAFGRPHLDKEMLASPPAVAMDNALHFANYYGDPILSPFKKLLRPVLGRFLRQDYSQDVIVLDASDLEKILGEARRRNFKAILIYFYSFNCPSCAINYGDINEIAAGFDKKRLLTLGIAVNTTPIELSNHFNVSGGLPNFKPFLLNKGEEGKIAGISYFSDSDYTKPPFVAIINENGRLFRMPYGFGRGEAIAAKVYEFVKE